MSEKEEKVASEPLLRLEAENRRQQNRLKDLEFRLAEVEIENSLLTSEISQITEPKDANQGAAHEVTDIERLRRKLTSVHHKSRDSGLIIELARNSLKSKQSDLEFIKAEMQELRSNIPPDPFSALQSVLEQKREEIVTNESMLEVFSNEEEAIKAREIELRKSLRIKGSFKAQPDTWTDEQALRKALVDARASADISRNELSQAIDELEALKNDNTYGTGDREGLARALFTELAFGNGSEDKALDALYQQETDLSQVLDKQLVSIRKDTQVIKSHREKCYERQKKQYDIAVSQQWLETLQQQLEDGK